MKQFPAFLFILILILHTSCYSEALQSQTPNDPVASTCKKIISLAPSISETIYALDLNQNLVGVTRFDSYPESVKSLPKVGSFLDLNLELILRLKATHVFAPAEAYSQIESLKQIGVNVISIDQRKLSQVNDSITTLGEICGVKDKATDVLKNIKIKVDSIKEEYSDLNPQTALFVVGAEKDKLYLSGTDGFYNELFKIVGIENSYNHLTSAFSSISEEGLLNYNPDFIIEIGEPNQESIALKILKNSKIKKISQLADNLIFVNDYFASIPGPRYPELLEKIEKERRRLPINGR